MRVTELATSHRLYTLRRRNRGAHHIRGTAFCCSCLPNWKLPCRGHAATGTHRTCRRSVLRPCMLWYTTTVYMLIGSSIHDIDNAVVSGFDAGQSRATRPIAPNIDICNSIFPAQVPEISRTTDCTSTYDRSPQFASRKAKLDRWDCRVWSSKVGGVGGGWGERIMAPVGRCHYNLLGEPK